MALLSQLYATTHKDIEARVTDQHFKASPLMRRLREFHGKVTKPGGRTIVEPFAVGSPGGGAYVGMEPFVAADDEELSGAEYGWVSYRRHPAISGMDEFKNGSGVVDIWNTKCELAGMGISDDIISDFLQAPANADLGKHVTPLEMIVDDGNTYTVGGLTSDDATLWQGNVNIPISGSGGALSLDDLEVCELNCSEGQEMPTDWVTTKVGYRTVWSLMKTNQRYVGSDKNAGFKNFTFNDALFHYDSHVLSTGGAFTGRRIYCLNLNHIRFIMGKGRAFVMEDKTPTNADGLVAMIKTYCQITCSARRYQGVVHDFVG